MITSNVWKGCAAGIAGGLTATIVMTGFQEAWQAISRRSSNDSKEGYSEKQASRLDAEDSQTESPSRNMGKQKSASENPTEKVARKVVSVAGTELSSSAKKKGGMVVHYAFGTLVGGLYGAALEFAPRRYRRSPLRSGLVMGSTLFAAADEIALPALSLTEGPTKTPVSAHIYGLLSHLVYGATAGLVTRELRKAI